MTEYPEKAWRPWLFEPVPHGFWKQLTWHVFHKTTLGLIILREIVNHLESEHAIKSMSDWQVLIDRQAFQSHYGISKLGGIGELLRLVYPDHPWICAPLGYSAAPSVEAVDWNQAKSRRQFLDQLRGEKSSEYFYELSLQTMHRYGGILSSSFCYSIGIKSKLGSRIVGLYEKSPALTIQVEYPEIAWNTWKFSSIRGWWGSLASAFQAGDPLAAAVVRNYIEFLQTKHAAASLSNEDEFVNCLSDSERGHVVLFGGIGQIKSILAGEEGELVGTIDG